MIPKTIHYCWFGGNPLPDLAVKCIKSWKKYCPDYEIVEWNEKNFDLQYNIYVREAYEAKKWAFVSDVVRLFALVNYGGIYMDTDVEVIKSLDDLLLYQSVSGFESETQIPTGLMACEKGNKMFLEFLNDYEGKHFIRDDGSLDLTTNVTYITNICLKHGLLPNNSVQTINGFTLLSRDYLCPKDHETREIHITDNTYTIHHFDGSWKSEEEVFLYELAKTLKKIPMGSYIAKLISVLRYRGMIVAIRESIGWIGRNHT